MELSTALHNLEIFKNLKPNERLYINSETEEISLDDRWGQSVRRWWDGSSRVQTINPINNTFSKIMTSDELNYNELLQIAIRLKETLGVTYPVVDTSDFESGESVPVENRIQNTLITIIRTLRDTSTTENVKALTKLKAQLMQKEKELAANRKINAFLNICKLEKQDIPQLKERISEIEERMKV